MPKELKILGLITIAAILLGWLLFHFGSQKPTAQPLTFREDAYSKGSLQAKIVLTEFGDFQCSACRNSHFITDKILAEYPKDVRLIFRHFPLSATHPRAAISAEVSEAAGAQGKFWEMHDLLYARQDEWGDIALNLSNEQVSGLFVQYAQQISLDIDKFSSDLRDGVYRSIVSADSEVAQSAGVNSTPTFFVNDVIVGESSYEAVKQAIEEALKQ